MTTKMRPIRDTIPLEEARALIDGAVRPVVRIERVALTAANGRVVAREVRSQVDVPPFARAGMDGYAVRAEDTFGASREEPKTFRCIEQVFTGQVPSRTVAARECTEIATGAPLPDGADAVVMVEESEKDDSGDVRIFTPVYPRQNVGRQGADIHA
ncbi:MAG: gephyrin-like molybdotransferase Glp, partial [Steroidobacteraceae bacterium]